MNIQKCASCGQESQGWVESCPHCSEPVANYARPAGCWIRVGASIVDWLVLIPIMILAFWNTHSLKSTAVLVLIDCVVAAFSFRKRALHDMLAESYCVYKEP